MTPMNVSKVSHADRAWAPKIKQHMLHGFLSSHTMIQVLSLRIPAAVGVPNTEGG